MGPIFKGQAIFLDCLTFEDGADILSRNVGTKLPFYAKQYPKRAQTSNKQYTAQDNVCSNSTAYSLKFGAGNFGKIWCACGQNEIQYAEWRMNK